MVDKRREQILALNEELRTVSHVLQKITLAENQESRFHIKIAYRSLHAYRENVSEKDVTVPKPEHLRDQEKVSEHYSRLRSDLVDARPELEIRQTELREQTIDYLDKLLDNLCMRGETKKNQVIALKEALQSDFRGDLIAEVLDCSSSYPGKFQWNDEQERIVLREDVEARRQNRFSDSQKEKIKQRDNQACVKCGSELRLRVHHIIPIEDGGGGDVDNGATLCKSCHDFFYQWENSYGEDYESVSEFWSSVTKESHE